MGLLPTQLSVGTSQTLPGWSREDTVCPGCEGLLAKWVQCHLQTVGLNLSAVQIWACGYPPESMVSAWQLGPHTLTETSTPFRCEGKPGLVTQVYNLPYLGS